jgi:hypothetical protein
MSPNLGVDAAADRHYVHASVRAPLVAMAVAMMSDLLSKDADAASWL